MNRARPFRFPATRDRSTNLMWDFIMNIREAPNVARSEDPTHCCCRQVPEREKDYFKHKLPGSCILEHRPYVKNCDETNCIRKAIVSKMVNITYCLTSASIEGYDGNSVTQSHRPPKYEKVPRTIKKTVKIALCLNHFENNYRKCCVACADKWERRSENNTKDV